MFLFFMYIKSYLSTTHKPYYTNVSSTYPQQNLPLIHRLPLTYPQCYPQPFHLSTDLSTANSHHQTYPQFPQTYPQPSQSYPQANFYNL